MSPFGGLVGTVEKLISGSSNRFVTETGGELRFFAPGRE